MGSSSVPRPADLDVVRESYDRVADNYVEMVTTTGLGDIRAHPWLRAAMDVFADAIGGLGPVLDVGCGPGTVTGYLVDRGVDASGVDLSPRMIEHARRLHPNCTFNVASSTELDLTDSSLAGVLGWWSLFNLPRDVLPQVAEASRSRNSISAGVAVRGREAAPGRWAISWTLPTVGTPPRPAVPAPPAPTDRSNSSAAATPGRW